MNPKLPSELMDKITSGESINVEFKKSATDITKDVYETVCSFSNRIGGDIFLGVKDDGSILGVQPDKVENMKKDFVNTVNNGNKINPPLYLISEPYDVDGKTIIHIHVPESLSVIRCGGRIFDRNNDSDIDITDNQHLVYQLYARKQNTYYVNTVFPALKVSDLRRDLIDRARRMTRVRTEHHPWMDMNDEELLRSAKLILTDPETGEEGLTLASILLFGSDSLIVSVLAHHKTDAIFRVFNTDRYDDRDVIVTNLLDSYDRLMTFGRKHLNDMFSMDGIVSISARDKILREIVSNLLAHRDYSNAYVAKFIIEKDRIYTENANRSHGFGALNVKAFSPYPKNPVISSVFREIGLADELGSGMKNTYKYTALYSGRVPEFIEGDVFRMIIPLNEAATATVGAENPISSDGVSGGAGGGVTGGAGGGVSPLTIKLDADKANALIAFCTEERTKSEMMEFCAIRSDYYFRANILKPLLQQGILKRTVPDKPNSPKQKYVKA